MNIVKVNIICIVTNYKHESKVVYEEGYINLDRITQVLIRGSIARVIFSGVDGDYAEIDTKEWEEVYERVSAIV